MTVRYCELFAGIGAQASALERLGVERECAGIAEVDPVALAVYEALHGPVPQLGDITRMEHLPPDLDLLTYSFPCQDLSPQGGRRGMEEGSGTRSGLVWEVGRLLRDARERDDLPRALVMENVPQVLSKRNRPVFDEWVSLLSGLGYASSYRIMDATEFGVPQRRRRCFMVSVLGDAAFAFPRGPGCTERMADRLEPESDVPDGYRLTGHRVETLVRHRERNEAMGRGFGFSPVDTDGPARTVTTRMREETCNLVVVGLADLRGHDIIRRVHDPDGACPTVCTSGGGNHQPKIIVDGDLSNLRRLTPRECWRLMGFTDAEFDRAAATRVNGRPVAPTHLYRLAGNSIVVDVLVALFDALLDERAPCATVRDAHPAQTTLDSF